jgi:hypothetical protein
LGAWGVGAVASGPRRAVTGGAITGRTRSSWVCWGTFDWFFFFTSSATLGFFVTARKKMQHE